VSDDPCIEFDLHGRRVWMRQSSYEKGEGPIMPAPYHDLTLELSYAHLGRDGRIMRFRVGIGSKDDLRPVNTA
jgi:hypothetical protein